MNSTGVTIFDPVKRTVILLSVLFALSLLGFGIRPSASSAPLPAPSISINNAIPAYCNGVYRGDTSDSTNEIDNYPCRSDWPETGPEHYYALKTTSSQPLSIILSHPPSPDLDLDIFLLQDSQLDQCYAADATLEIESLPPGEHLIVVDGFDGSQGSYVLSVDCSETPLATATPTDTPPPSSTPTPTLQPTETPTPTATATRPKLTYYSFLPSQNQRHPQPTPQPSTIVLQQGIDDYEGVVDSYINAWEISANYANVDRLALRQPDVMDPVIRFELDKIPSDAHITQATLSLWPLSRTNENPATVGSYRISRSWKGTEITWQQAYDDEPWFSAGANGTPQDREPTPRDVQLVDNIQHWYQWNITALVQEWINNPETNNGVILKAYDEPKVYYAFASAEYNNPNARPKLTISYWTPPSSANLDPR